MEPGVPLKILDIRDQANTGDGNSPENYQSGYESKGSDSPNDSLPPRDLQRAPNYFLRIDANISRRHYVGLVFWIGSREEESYYGGLGDAIKSDKQFEHRTDEQIQ